LSISFFLFLFVGTQSSTNGVGTGIPTSGSQSIGGGVFMCTGRSPWSGLLSREASEIVRVCMRVVSLYSNCT
jgi:hypothetical protein